MKKNYDVYEAESIEIIETKDVSKLDKALALVNKVPILKDLVNDVPMLVNMIKDYTKGNYKKIPLKTIILITSGIVYLISPIDAIPDVLPMGYTDDLGILGAVLKSAHDDIQAYKEWKACE